MRTLDRAADADALMALDEAIHRFAWEGSRNPYLIETLERYFVLSLRVWYVVLDRVPGLGTAVFDHTKLLEAILGGDDAAARGAHARARGRVRARDHGRLQPRVATNFGIEGAGSAAVRFVNRLRPSTLVLTLSTA